MQTYFVPLSSKNFPFLVSMFDPTDPGHTEGVPQYFIEQINEKIEEDGMNLSLFGELRLLESIQKNYEYIVVG